MQHVGDAVDRLLGYLALGERAADDLEPRARLEHAVVTQRAHRQLRKRAVVGGGHPPDERLPDLPGRAGDEDASPCGHRTSMTSGMQCRPASVTCAERPPLGTD